MTVDFSHGYTPPGVTVEEQATTSIVITGTPPARAVLIGPGIGHRSNTEQIALNDDPVVLTEQGVDLTSIVVTDVATGAVLVANTDYDVTTAGNLADDTYYTSINRHSGSTEDPGTPVLVAYNYIPPDYYQAKVFDNFEDVKDYYGEPVNLLSQQVGDLTYQAVLSPLSLAAQLAFEQGAGELILVAIPLPDSSAVTDAQKSAEYRANLAAAYQAIASDPTATVVVPITSGIITADAAGTATDLLTHVNTVSEDNFLRIGIIGFDPSVTTTPDVIATALSSKRVMVAYAAPGGLQYYSGGSNTAFPLGHEYLAAAYAGLMTAQDPQVSLTRQQVRGFLGLSGTPLSNSLKNQYGAAGVAISEVDRLNRLVVRHSLMTDVSSINTRESSVVRAKDALILSIEDGLEESGLIGDPIDDSTPIVIKSVMATLLESAVTSGLIVSYASLGVRQQSVDPTVMEVKFSYKPAYPLNYILVAFTIDMQSGNVNQQTAA